ncbi:hypothetical protein IJI02_00060 [Candidatus Saccharibacteria bacterium]|nr:hypothetical protein [Candidatus Saccharibacteria bacterium]
MSSKTKRDYNVIVPRSYVPKPSLVEMSAADILVDFFEADVKLIKRGSGKTPDFLIKGIYWELKSPTGSGKHNIQHKIQDAAEQSRNIIIDGRESKLHPLKLKHEVQHQFDIIKKAKRLILIDKSGKAVEIFRNK